MRKAIIILCLCLPFAANAANYYVATNGNDSNPGTIAQPWATWQKGFSSIVAGDLLYIRGGTYTPSGTSVGSVLCGAGASGKNGTASNLYKVYAYPGEVPVLNCINLTGSSVNKAGVILNSCSYWEVKGLSVTNVKQANVNYESQGIRIEGGHHNTISCTSYGNEGPGFRIRTPGGNENHFLNCDAYSNYDPLKNGDDADGFDFGFASNNYIVRATGCRAWDNGDDGYDMYQYSGFTGIYHLDNCWAWHNGYKPGTEVTAGDGNGFKLGLDGQTYDGVTKRYLRNCVAYNNRQRGYSQESARVKKEFYNCTSYMNQAWGFSFGWTGDASGFEVADILRNNIAFGDGVENLHGGTFYASRTSERNSWDSGTGVTVSAADFASVDGTELERQRKSDGSLPDINFLHLVSGSDLIDKGADAGLPFIGKAPDLGAFELQTSSTSVTPPVYKSGIVENAAPSLLVLTYDLNLNTSIVPAATSFNVLVNSAARAVNSVAISGTKVQLTLASALTAGDIVTVSYIKPASNPLQSTAGGIAATISAQAITNSLSSTGQNSTAPTITMTINPNPVHKMLNILFAYASTFSLSDPLASPQIVRILDVSGKLFIEKLLVTGVASIKFPINLRSGIYTVMVLSGGMNVSSQKVIVY